MPLTNVPKPMEPLSPEDIARFWSKVEIKSPDECWMWIGGVLNEYGRFKYKGREYKANRIVLFLKTGEDPGPDYRACHSCDTPLCMNPDHIWKGTVLDNVHDRDEKGRAAAGDRHWTRRFPEKLHRGPMRPELIRYGDKHPRATITATVAADVYLRCKIRGERQIDVAAELGIPKHIVHDIIRRRNWRSATESLART